MSSDMSPAIDVAAGGWVIMSDYRQTLTRFKTSEHGQTEEVDH